MASYWFTARPENVEHQHPFLVFDNQDRMHLPLTRFAKEARSRLDPKTVPTYLYALCPYFTWLEYRQETVDLDALLWEITDTLQQTSPSHTLVVRGTVGTSLIGDRDRLGQVFINLISNAIKYSPDAKTVEIDLSTSEETVTICVRDHGLGIPREQRDKIFERFYRAAGPKQRVIPGLGMGLYIVAEIVKRHGGTITVDSEVGKGSTFTVILPCKRDA